MDPELANTESHRCVAYAGSGLGFVFMTRCRLREFNERQDSRILADDEIPISQNVCEATAKYGSSGITDKLD